jgi:MSHA pilin protein MshC
MKQSSGFTLVELIMVIVIVGILSVTAAPRFFDNNTFNIRGFLDETLAMLRYAQKTAVAQRRTVCIAFTSVTATLTIASAAGSAICDTPLTGPNGVAPYTVTARFGVSYAAVPINFSFNALGVPSFNLSQVVQVSNFPAITIEAGTGYVHE